jgi:hypothetical protein
MTRDMEPKPTDDRVEDQYPNCSATLTGPYCSTCGQRQVDLDQPFRELAGEAMESVLSFDARILRTLWPLIATMMLTLALTAVTV